MRNWLNDARSYIEPVKINEVMRALGIGHVIESKDPKFKVGDLVRVPLPHMSRVEKARGMG